MQQRRVTAPDGTKWIVGRRWLLHRPRYFGFRFGVDKSEPEFEPAANRTKVERRPAPTKPPTPPVVRYKSKAKPRRRRRRTWSGWGSGGSGGGWSFPFPSGRSGGGSGRSSGGGSRGSSGGGRRGSSGGGKRSGGGGGGGGAIGAILSALLTALKYIAIALAVIAVALFVVFVLIPSLVFLLQYLAFWIVIGLTVLYRALSGRPWIVELEEADGYRVRSWRVVGWGESKAAIDEIAEALRSGADPVPSGGEPVEIVNAHE